MDGTTNNSSCSDGNLRRYEFGSSKYWEITVTGSSTMISYGAIGAKPRLHPTDHANATAAQKFAEKKIREKTKKGYSLVGKEEDNMTMLTTTTKKRKEAASVRNETSIPTNAKKKTKNEDTVFANIAPGGGKGHKLIGATTGGLLIDGENRTVQGSARNPYTVSRRGDVYSCTCAGWRFQKINIALRTCKHIASIQGNGTEIRRTTQNTTLLAASTLHNNTAKNLPIPGVMLAKKYERKHEASIVVVPSSTTKRKGGNKNEGATTTTGWYMSEKLDGLRALWDGTTFRSRNGNAFFAPKEFTQDFPKDIILDGELFCGRGNFDTASSLVRSIGGSYDQWKDTVSYEIFEAPLLGGKDMTFEERIPRIQNLAQTMKHGNAVVQVPIRTIDQLNTKLATIEAENGEGLMLRKKDSTYAYSRSNNLLKVKTMHDAEAQVIGHEEGKGKYRGLTGALICKIPSTGKQFKVGSGLTDLQRANPAPVGTTIVFGYFELTKQGIPRFPTFKRIHTKE